MSRVASIVLFCAIVVLAVDPPLGVLAFQNRAVRHEILRRRADPSPELASFVAGIRAHTKTGDAIALVLPMRDWERYSRAYFRGSFALAGRTVLPVIARDGSVVRENVERAQYVAAWHVRYAGEGTVIWRGHGGALVRKP